MYIHANNTKVIFDVVRVSPIKISSKVSAHHKTTLLGGPHEKL